MADFLWEGSDGFPIYDDCGVLISTTADSSDHLPTLCFVLYVCKVTSLPANRHILRSGERLQNLQYLSNPRILREKLTDVSAFNQTPASGFPFVFACDHRVDMMSSKPVPSSEDIRQKGNTFYKNGKVSEGI